MLLTRAPLPIARAFDLHVLGLPPAFVLSQDQTLKLNLIPLLNSLVQRISYPGTSPGRIWRPAKVFTQTLTVYETDKIVRFHCLGMY